MGLLESFAYGIPSIITFGTNVGDMIIKYNSGFCSNCSVSGIKDSLIKMLSISIDDYFLMRKNALELAKEYDWDRIADMTHHLYLDRLNLKK